MLSPSGSTTISVSKCSLQVEGTWKIMNLTSSLLVKNWNFWPYPLARTLTRRSCLILMDEIEDPFRDWMLMQYQVAMWKRGSAFDTSIVLVPTPNYVDQIGSKSTESGSELIWTRMNPIELATTISNESVESSMNLAYFLSPCSSISISVEKSYSSVK